MSNVIDFYKAKAKRDFDRLVASPFILTVAEHYRIRYELEQVNNVDKWNTYTQTLVSKEKEDESK